MCYCLVSVSISIIPLSIYLSIYLFYAVNKCPKLKDEKNYSKAHSQTGRPLYIKAQRERLIVLYNSV